MSGASLCLFVLLVSATDYVAAIKRDEDHSDKVASTAGHTKPSMREQLLDSSERLRELLGRNDAVAARINGTLHTHNRDQSMFATSQRVKKLLNTASGTKLSSKMKDIVRAGPTHSLTKWPLLQLLQACNETEGKLRFAGARACSANFAAASALPNVGESEIEQHSHLFDELLQYEHFARVNVQFARVIVQTDH